jgi:hypothetical protein
MLQAAASGRVDPTAVYGDTEEERFCTSHVDRKNLTMPHVHAETNSPDKPVLQEVG